MRNSRKWKRKKVLMMVIIRISSLTTMMIGTKRRKYVSFHLFIWMLPSMYYDQICNAWFGLIIFLCITR